MDSNHIQQESKDFAEKLASADPLDFDYAINQYFEDNAHFVTDVVAVHGVSKIKKLFGLASSVKAEGKLVGQPRYDSHQQTLKFKTSSTYISPSLPSIVPFHARLSGFKSTTTFDLVAHLAPNGDEQGDGGVKGQKLFVTKLEGSQVDVAFLQRVLPVTLFRPLITLTLLFTASAVAFTQKHKSDNPLQFALAAVAAIWAALWDTLTAESSRRQAQAEQWREKATPQLKQLYDQALSTASKVQADLEARGKAAGIPLDDYKRRATQAITDLSENVEARAKAAGVPVDEYRKQAESIIADLRKRAGELGDRAQEKGEKVVQEVQEQGEEVKDQAKQTEKAAKKKANKSKNKAQNSNGNGSGSGNASDNATTTTIDAPEKSHAEIQAEFDKVPHTPLGGHDPTAPNAPSFAHAAQL